MQQFRAGNEAAFTELYHQFYKRVFYFAQRYVGEADAQDVTADAFIELWNKRTDFEEIKHLAKFLFIVVRNRCFDMSRRKKSRYERLAELALLMEQKVPETPFYEHQVRALLLELLEKEVLQLPEKTREVFLLSFREGLKPAQIAERLGLSVKTIKNQKLSAITLLKAAVANHPLQALLVVLLIKLEETVLV